MRIISRRFCLALLATAGWCGGPNTQFAHATETQISLKARLEKDLKARRPQEFDFIARVVALVDTGKLPRKDVERIYLWARRQPERPFQHFQFAMQQVAEKLGIEL